MIWKWKIYTKTNSCILMVFQNTPQILPISHCSLYHVQPILKIPPNLFICFTVMLLKANKPTSVIAQPSQFSEEIYQTQYPSLCTYSQLFLCHFQWLSSIEEKKSNQVDQLLLVCCLFNTLYLFSEYRKVSNIRHTKSENLSDCRLVLQLPLANTLKPSVKSRMKM